MQLIEDNFRTVRNPFLPPWCPDWHTDIGGMSLSRWPEACTGILGGQFRRIEPFMQVNEDSSLEIDGLLVDVIDHTTASAGQNMLSLESYPWLIECLKIIKSTPFVPYDVYPTTADIPAVPNTLADGSSISESRQRYQTVEEVLRYTLYPPGVLLDSSPRTILQCNGCKFFRTKASMLGIGPSNLKENDILCAMHGSRALWALRPRKSSDKAGDQQGAEEQ